MVLTAIIAGVLLIFQKKGSKNNLTTLQNPAITVDKNLEDTFPGLVIPDDSERIELKNVSGEEGMGIATKSEILADLPDLEVGKTYQVLLSNGQKTVVLGNLKKAKGGFLLEYDLSKYPNYNQILVVKGAKHVLEGSF